MKKTLFILFLILIYSSIFAREAKIISLDGQVRIKKPGQDWQIAKSGMNLQINNQISTGFRSYVKIDTGNAQLTVQQLTRISLQELKEKQGETSTSLYLNGGKIRAQVKKSTGKLETFKVSSPVSVASVRGTDFIYTGDTLDVLEGLVLYSSFFGERFAVGAREWSSFTPAGESTSPAQAAVDKVFVPLKQNPKEPQNDNEKSGRDIPQIKNETSSIEEGKNTLLQGEGSFHFQLE